MRKRFASIAPVAVGLAVAALALLTGGGGGGGAASADGFGLGSALPDLELATPAGAEVELGKFRMGEDEKPVPLVVTFWSYKCPTGKRSMARFAELAKACKEKGAKLVGICSYGESAADIAAYVEKNGIAYPLAVDAGSKAVAAFDAGVVTETYVFDRDGKLVYHGGLGTTGEPWPEKAVDAVLAGKAVEKAETDARG